MNEKLKTVPLKEMFVVPTGSRSIFWVGIIAITLADGLVLGALLWRFFVATDVDVPN